MHLTTNQVFDEIRKGEKQGANAMFIWLFQQGIIQEEVKRLLHEEIIKCEPFSDRVDNVREDLRNMVFCSSYSPEAFRKKMGYLENQICGIRKQMNNEVIKWCNDRMNRISISTARNQLVFHYHTYDRVPHEIHMRPHRNRDVGEAILSLFWDYLRMDFGLEQYRCMLQADLQKELYRSCGE